MLNKSSIIYIIFNYSSLIIQWESSARTLNRESYIIREISLRSCDISLTHWRTGFLKKRKFLTVLPRNYKSLYEFCQRKLPDDKDNKVKKSLGT